MSSINNNLSINNNNAYSMGFDEPAIEQEINRIKLLYRFAVDDTYTLPPGIQARFFDGEGTPPSLNSRNISNLSQTTVPDESLDQIMDDDVMELSKEDYLVKLKEIHAQRLVELNYEVALAESLVEEAQQDWRPNDLKSFIQSYSRGRSPLQIVRKFHGSKSAEQIQKLIDATGGVIQLYKQILVLNGAGAGLPVQRDELDFLDFLGTFFASAETIQRFMPHRTLEEIREHRNNEAVIRTPYTSGVLRTSSLLYWG